jgi:hypothetical protein
MLHPDNDGTTMHFLAPPSYVFLKGSTSRRGPGDGEFFSEGIDRTPKAKDAPV